MRTAAAIAGSRRAESDKEIDVCGTTPDGDEPARDAVGDRARPRPPRRADRRRAARRQRGASRWRCRGSLDPGARRGARSGPGSTRLYSHQAEALEAAARRQHDRHQRHRVGQVALLQPAGARRARARRRSAARSTSTRPRRWPRTRRASWRELRPPRLRQAIYDGDTPREERPAIRSRSEPRAHQPRHAARRHPAQPQSWGDFLANLGWVVVDEAHTYRGVFGSHVANVLRRLRRVARAYGAEPRFLLTSATIANPLELAEGLTGDDFKLVDYDGAPRAGREIAMWNPPLIDEATGTRRSALSEAAELLADLVVHGVRTICFLSSRRGVELIQRFARECAARRAASRTGGADRPLPGRLHAAAAARDRARLAGGELLAVVATDALELGIDIGELDAAICVTFPGTVASLRQMWGRAGPAAARARRLRRRRGRARPVLLPPPGRVPRAAGRGGDPRPRATSRSHRATWSRPPTRLPLTDADDERLRRGLARARRAAGRARASCAGARRPLLPRGSDFVGRRISLRSASPDSFAVVERDSGELIGLVEAERAFTTIHPGAVYLHLGRSYEVERARHRRAAARSSRASTATGTRSRRRRPRSTSSRCASSAAARASSCTSAWSRSPSR